MGASQSVILNSKNRAENEHGNVTKTSKEDKKKCDKNEKKRLEQEKKEQKMREKKEREARKKFKVSPMRISKNIRCSVINVEKETRKRAMSLSPAFRANRGVAGGEVASG